MSYDFEIKIDKEWPECCAIDTQSWIKEKLGEPLQIPDDLCNDWASKKEEEVIAHIKTLTGEEYTHVAEGNPYNSDNDFSDVFVYHIFVPVDDSEEWIFADDVFVTIETHIGGDVRGNYRAFDLYRVNSLADSGFFDFVLGWRVEYANGEPVEDADEFSVGYSQHPFYHLSKSLKGEKMQWSEKRQAFLAWYKGRAVQITPSPY